MKKKEKKEKERKKTLFLLLFPFSLMLCWATKKRERNLGKETIHKKGIRASNGKEGKYMEAEKAK